MRKHTLGLAVILAAILTLLAVSTASAAPPVAISQTIDVTVGDPELTIPVSQVGTDPDGDTVLIYQTQVSSPCVYLSPTQFKYTPPPTLVPDQTCTVWIFDGNSPPFPPVIASVTFRVNPAAPPPDTTIPVVDITSPVDGSTVEADTVTLNYTATDNDTTLDCSLADGSTLTLNEGLNTFTVVCEDDAGNEGSDAVSVTYTPPPPPDTINPVVDITSPADGSTTTNGTATLHFTVSDDQDASPTCSSTDGEQLVLNTGLNTFTVVCEDDAGNQGSDAVTVIYNPPPPTLTVSPGYGLEGDPGQPATYVEFPVTLSHAWHEDIDILYWALPGTAGTNDFESNILIPKLITIPAGSTSTVIKVRIKHDLKKDDNEFLFLLHISCDLGTAGVTTGIIDDDAGG